MASGCSSVILHQQDLEPARNAEKHVGSWQGDHIKDNCIVTGPPGPREAFEAPEALPSPTSWPSRPPPAQTPAAASPFLPTRPGPREGLCLCLQADRHRHPPPPSPQSWDCREPRVSPRVLSGLGGQARGHWEDRDQKGPGCQLAVSWGPEATRDRGAGPQPPQLGAPGGGLRPAMGTPPWRGHPHPAFRIATRRAPRQHHTAGNWRPLPGALSPAPGPRGASRCQDGCRGTVASSASHWPLQATHTCRTPRSGVGHTLTEGDIGRGSPRGLRSLPTSLGRHMVQTVSSASPPPRVSKSQHPEPATVTLFGERGL